MEECVCPHDVHVVYPNAHGPYGLQNPTASSPCSKPSQAFSPPSITPIPHVPYLLVKDDATFSTCQCKKVQRGMVRSRLDMRTAKRAGKKREGMDGSRPSLSVWSNANVGQDTAAYNCPLVSMSNISRRPRAMEGLQEGSRGVKSDAL